MTMFFLQAVFIIAVAFGLGCLFGCWLKGRFGAPQHHSGSAGAVTHSGAAKASTAGELASSRPHYEPSSTPQRAADLPAGSAATPESLVAPQADPISAAAVAPVVPPSTSTKAKATKAGSAKAGAAKSAKSKPAATKSAASKAAKPKPAATKSEPVTAAKPAAAAKPTAAAAPDTKPAKAGAAKAAKAKPAASKASEKPAAAPKSAAKSTTKPAATAKAKPAPAKAQSAKAQSATAKAAKAEPTAASVPDNLKQIKGVGPQIEAKLNAAGINSFAQIAAWTKKQQVEFSEQLSFAGRIEREDWVGQAKILAKGGSTEFAKRVARGEVESSADTKKPKSKG